VTELDRAPAAPQVDGPRVVAPTGPQVAACGGDGGAPPEVVTVHGGPGTGRSEHLVRHVVDLAVAGVAIEEVAVVAATEAAAADLERRIRAAVEAAWSAAPSDPGLGVWGAALGELAIGDVATVTGDVLLHAQGWRVGLAAGFHTLDGRAAHLAVDAAWAAAADGLFSDGGARQAAERALELGTRARDLAALWHSLAGATHRVGDIGDIGAEIETPVPQPDIDVEPVLAALDGALGDEASCSADDDLLLLHLLRTVRPARRDLEAARHHDLDVLRLLRTLEPFGCRFGAKEHWGGRARAVRDACRAAELERQRIVDNVGAAALAELVRRLAIAASDATTRRAAAGAVTRCDLLVLARRMGRGGEVPPAVRIRHWLVDDIDAMSDLEIDVLDGITGGLDGPGRRSVVLASDARAVAGVGAMVTRIAEGLDGRPPPSPAGAEVTLRPSRDEPGPAEPASSGADPGVAQLSFEGIVPRQAPTRRRSVPVPVVVLGGPVQGSRTDVRRRAAHQIAEVATRIVAEGWPVVDGTAVRAARWDDVAVLVSDEEAALPISDAMETAGVPYRLQGGALLWNTAEVRDTLALLAAADDPCDHVAVLAALRSPALACGDDDLVTWHRAGGGWDPVAARPPGSSSHPVSLGLDVIAGLTRDRWWHGPATMVRKAVERGHGWELAFGHPRPEGHWDRLRWLCARARGYESAGGTSLRAFLRWAGAGTDDGVEGLMSGASADDAVRVMRTADAAGREFPVVIAAGLDRDDGPGKGAPSLIWDGEGRPQARAGTVRTSGYDAAVQGGPDAARRDRLHLAVVAVTRARDHLVLSLYRRDTAGPDGSAAAAIQQVCDHRPDLWRRLPIIDGPPHLPGDHVSL
jgi:ATP-dependent helicase/nuclease subunit A